MLKPECQLNFKDRTSLKGLVFIEHYRNGKLLGIKNILNVFTNVGKAEMSKLLINTGTHPTQIGIGTGTTAAAVGDTDIETQVESWETAALSTATIAITDDAAQYVYTFTLTGDHDVAEACLRSTVPALYCRQTFTPIAGKSGDDIRITWKLQH